MRCLSININFLHDWEGCSHLDSCEFNNLFIGYSFLIQELRARKSNNLDAILLIFFMHVDQLNVAFMGEGSLRCNIDDNCQSSALEKVTKLVVLTLDALD